MAIVRIMRDLDRTLVKVTWQAGGDCVLFPEDLKETHLGFVRVSPQSVASSRELHRPD